MVAPQLVLLTCLLDFGELVWPPSNWCPSSAHCRPPSKPSSLHPFVPCPWPFWAGSWSAGKFQVNHAAAKTATNCFGGATKLFTQVSAPETTFVTAIRQVFICFQLYLFQNVTEMVTFGKTYMKLKVSIPKMLALSWFLNLKCTLE